MSFVGRLNIDRMVKFSRKGDTAFSNSVNNQINITHVLVTLILCGVSFYTGALAGMSVGSQAHCDKAQESPREGNLAPRSSVDEKSIEAIVNKRVQIGQWDILLGIFCISS